MKKLTYIQGAFILGITNLVTGMLAFGFRVYFSQNISAEGMGVYQLVLPLYMLLITLVSGGITTAISKIIAEYKVRKNIASIQKTMKISFVMIGLWSLILCLGILLNIEFITNKVIKDSRTTLSVIILTPAVFFISMSAVFRGFFFGLQEIKFPALIDIGEKIIRLGGLIIITRIMIPHGIEYACAAAMFATTIGEFLSVCLLFISYNLKKIRTYNKYATDSVFHIISKIIRLAIPLSLAGALATIMDMISAVLVPDRLRIAGYDTSTALALYGELTGMVIPLIFFPGIIIYALSITLVPAVTQSHVGSNYIALNKKCNDSLAISWSIGLLATVLCISFPNELCNLFYKRPQAGDLLFWMGLGCAFHYLHLTQFSILNGLGMQKRVLSNIILDILITVGCIYFLIPIAQIGIYGYVVGFIASGVLISIRNMIVLSKQKQMEIKYTRVIIRPILPFLCMLFFVKMSNVFLKSIGFTYNMILSGLLGAMVFIILLFISGTFTLNQFRNTFKFNK